MHGETKRKIQHILGSIVSVKLAIILLAVTTVKAPCHMPN